jgi:serine/threonine-protein kinase
MQGRRIGNYRVVRPIGEGGMGTVYEAVHVAIEQRVAIKVLSQDLAQNPSVVRRFCNEARAASVLEHPGVVKIYDYGKLPDGTVYLLMEYLHGESLYSRLQNMAGCLSVREALRLCRQVADTLAVAHGKGIVHRDIKPGNIFLVPDPEAEDGERVKVLDFGLAKFLLNSGLYPADPALHTAVGMALGTPPYMSPEQCRGDKDVSGKADVYALGALLYRLICGQPPFSGENLVDVFSAHLYAPVPRIRARLPAVPQDVDALVEAMMMKEPALRPTMAQVAARLRELEGAEAMSDTIVERPSVAQAIRQALAAGAPAPAQVQAKAPAGRQGRALSTAQALAPRRREITPLALTALGVATGLAVLAAGGLLMIRLLGDAPVGQVLAALRF